ncbi:MAG: hypothetical protein M3082_02910 [Candidatus Dormibacteraeota bacterium]|nr:hypothetical protein [Candidatus Dormibacteraeota bacterium]
MTVFKKLVVVAIGAVSLVGAGSGTALAHESPRLLEFNSMTPVTGAAVGTVNHRGITGGGLPWAIASGRGSVTANGEVEVTVKGLVIPVAPFNGTNPVPLFGAIVSCISSGGSIVNVSTKLFPANLAGDSTIEDTVVLPNPCKHALLFVVSPGPNAAWFSRSNPRDHEGD